VDIVQKMSDDPITICPFCNKETLRRVITASKFHLKGGGWEKDGYNKPEADK
jgi:putative FmdB family regulatory protein